MARSNGSTGWNGEGSGHVFLEKPSADILGFSELGTWTPIGAANPLVFRNVFRWTLSTNQRTICLEHLRFGPDNPVYLFDLYPQNPLKWETISPHICNHDTYEARVELHDKKVIMRWTIKGPEKQENLVYTYT